MLAMRAFPKVNGAGAWKALVSNHSVDRLGPVVRVANVIWERDLRTNIWIVKGENGGQGLPRRGCHDSTQLPARDYLADDGDALDQKRCPLPIGSAYNQLSVKRFRWSF